MQYPSFTPIGHCEKSCAVPYQDQLWILTVEIAALQSDKMSSVMHLVVAYQVGLLKAQQSAPLVDGAGHISNAEVCKANGCQDRCCSPQEGCLLGDAKRCDSIARNLDDQLQGKPFSTTGSQLYASA